MPIHPSVYQYCEALDIPVEYLDDYEIPAESKQFELKNLFLVLIILLAIPITIIFASAYLSILLVSRFLKKIVLFFSSGSGLRTSIQGTTIQVQPLTWDNCNK